VGRNILLNKYVFVLAIIFFVVIYIFSSIEHSDKNQQLSNNIFSSNNNMLPDLFGTRSWWDPDWEFSEKITINHNKVEGDLTNFPVLFSIASDDLKNAQVDGDDFIFVSNDNTTKYHHEIERYNHSTGELISWVNITSISPDIDTVFYIYYGNPNCANQENVAQTWDSNYIGIFHMDQVNGSLFDSAGTQNATKYENDTIYQEHGKVGYCVELGGYIDGGYFLIEGENNAYKFHNNDVTLEAWINLDQDKLSDDTILFMGRSSTFWPPWPQMTLRKLKSTEENGKFIMRCGQSNETKNNALSNDGGASVIGKWIHAVGVVDYSGDEISLYIDGIKQTVTDTVEDYDLSSLPSYHFKVAIGYDGMGEDPNYNYLDGSVDELRISNIARSQAWISTSYNNMVDPELFMIFGDGYTITTSSLGNGTIIKNPDQTTYFPNTEVEITAEADIGWTFSHWSGDIPLGHENDNPITITMDDNKEITAHFTEIMCHLTLRVEGQGSILVDPEGGLYPFGSEIELNAIGDPGWIFDHWDDDLNGTINPNYITMFNNYLITAVFHEISSDTIPPIISNIIVNPSSAFQGSFVNITCDVTDNVDVDTVCVNITFPDFTFENITMNGDIYSINQTYSMTGTFSFYIWANDTSNNSNTSYINYFEIIIDAIDVYFHLDTGWNLITIPIENNYTAKTLSENITGCELVSWFDSSNQTYRSYIVGGPPGFNFQIKDGHGYFIVVNQSSIFSLSGYQLSTISIPLHIGWNLIGWNQIYDTTASSLAENITSCELVSWFDSSNQTYRSYIVGGPPGFDFTITSGMGLFIVVNEESIWNGEG